MQRRAAPRPSTGAPCRAASPSCAAAAGDRAAGTRPGRGGLVAADAFEDAGPVVEAVRADVDLRVVPVHQLAVHPDLLGGLHRWLLFAPIGARNRTSGHDEVGRRGPREPHELGRRQHRPCGASTRRRPRARPATRSARSISTRSTVAQRKRRDGAGLEACHLASPRAARATRPRCARRTRDLARVGAPVAGHEREHRPAVADDDERLDDLREVAADAPAPRPPRCRPDRELLDARLRAGRAEERRHTLDSAGQLATRDSTGGASRRSEMKRASSKPSPCRRSTSSGGAGVSIDSAISALPPRRVRETVMFAMLTPASPNSRPDAADHAGHVVVAEDDQQRRELHLELEAERAHEPVPVLAADRRARDADRRRRRRGRGS